MDDRGRIYEVDEESKTKKNVDTGKTTELKAGWEREMTMLPPDQIEMLKGLNRKARREWLKRFKSKLRQLQAQKTQIEELKNEIT